MNVFQREYLALREEIREATRTVMLKGNYILGKELETFEQRFATYLGAKYCIGVANGYEALQISLIALGIKEGDEVITVSNTFIATALAISAVGATPVFADIGPDYLIDPKDVEAKITTKTKAIIPVHLYGQTCDIPALQDIATKHGLKIIEDACQAHGAELHGRKAGTYGDIGCFSFYPTKNLGAYGDGGALVTDSEFLYDQALQLRNYGKSGEYAYAIRGINSRLDELQAAILNVKLSYLDRNNMVRNLLARRYWFNLRNLTAVILPLNREGEEKSIHVYHQYVVRAERRDELRKFLAENQIATHIHYPIPIHKQVAYNEYTDLSLPVTENITKNILSLPIHHFMGTDEVDSICNLIVSFYK